MIDAREKPDCICIRASEANRAVIAPGEPVERRDCYVCGAAVFISEMTIHWERDVRRRYRREPRYGCEICFLPNGERREARP